MTERYFQWLAGLVADGHKKIKYGCLLRKLYNKEFYWVVPMDENRAEDGKELRWLFEVSVDDVNDISELDGPCSVLEMLIALARRWRMDLTSKDGSEKGFELYFWLMIKNLGLDKCTDKKFDESFVDEKLHIWLDREYSADGKGGLFPLKTYTKNEEKGQNTKDIWYQLQSYLADNGYL